MILLTASLDKKTLAITRKDLDAQEFSELVLSEGGKAISLPAIEIVPRHPKVIEEFIGSINEKRHDYCLFMSSQAVEVLCDLARRINKINQVLSALASTTVVAIGPKTRASLIRHGIYVKILPQKYSSEGLVELFSKMGSVTGKRIIIPRSGASNAFVRNSLSSLGMIVEEVFLYNVLTSDTDSNWKDFILLLNQKNVDAIIFTSASNVRSFFDIMNRLSSKTESLLNNVKAVIAIGPFTNEELRKRNIQTLEAKEHTIRGTVELAKVVLNQK